MRSMMLNWKGRHIGTLLLATILILAFAVLRSDWSPMHKWNRAFGDASVILIALAMVLGPLSRLWRRTTVVLEYRRELGIWGFFAGLVHGGFILFGWVVLEVPRLFGFEFHPGLSQYVMFDKGFGLGNVIGIMALAYGAVLAITSNDLSQKWLGSSVWKYFQQGSYILWAIIVAHTFYFLFLHFQDFHRAVPEPNVLRWPFIGLVLSVVALQSAASWRTWQRSRHGVK